MLMRVTGYLHIKTIIDPAIRQTYSVNTGMLSLRTSDLIDQHYGV
jgi:hypothetical protein